MPVLRGSRSGSEGGSLTGCTCQEVGEEGFKAPHLRVSSSTGDAGVVCFFAVWGAGSSLGERKVQSSRGKAGAEMYGMGVGGDALFGCRETRERQRKEKKRPNNGAERV